MLDTAALPAGERVLAFIRHAEKDPVSFGLTAAGREAAVLFGRQILELGRPARIISSPEDRCYETAELIYAAVNTGAENFRTGGVMISPALGKPGIQVKNETAYGMLTDTMRCRDIFRKWKTGQYGDAMRNPDDIRSLIWQLFLDTSLDPGITVYVSQSGTVACSGYALGLKDYMAGDDSWVNFLDGYALSL
jgi:hypothetical protein